MNLVQCRNSAYPDLTFFRAPCDTPDPSSIPQAKAAAWKSSVRNRYDAVDDLHRQVMNLPGTAKSGRDVVALSHLMYEQEALLEDLFRNEKLGWKSGITRVQERNQRKAGKQQGRLHCERDRCGYEQLQPGDRRGSLELVPTRARR